MNQKNFVSPKLDTPNSRYKFLKFATKTRKKTNKEKSNFQPGATARYTQSMHPRWPTAGARRSIGPTRQRNRGRDAAVDRR